MKKTAVFIILFSFIPYVYADEIVVPNDLTKGIGKIIEYVSDMNFIERVLINQIIKNSSINGLKLKKCSAENLIKYFNQDKMFKKISSNKLIEPITGVTLEFQTDGKCKKKNKCAIVVDLNNNSNPIVFNLQNKRSGLNISFPEI